ncbi:hypothetical protein ABC337_15275 [Arthrobacter sp. 1P04PC]|uniref:hypothetical protein n=1 Tax=unclassified Arthrobacter TaxID=235627 RepID=UPI00399FE8BF
MSKPQTADSATSAAPGSDWRDVEEGTEYTAEQLARRFLDSNWDDQVAMAEKALDNAGTATACHILNHEGAHIFATGHSCQDRYNEGWTDALNELSRQVNADGQ